MGDMGASVQASEVDDAPQQEQHESRGEDVVDGPQGDGEQHETDRGRAGGHGDGAGMEPGRCPRPQQS